jgi:hypothetical protein
MMPQLPRCQDRDNDAPSFKIGKMSTAFIEKKIDRAGSLAAPAQRYPREGYRADIDGLRAVAILSVIAFHFNIGPVPGGFIGVDIFFVISGYLITGNIIDGLNAGSFTLLDFYRRRIRRIFPALLVVLAFVFLIALTVRRNDELFSVTRPFGETYHAIAAGAAFVTNLTLLQSANYFTQTASTQPLLHLWSLGIEEQFYIAWPLTLLAVSRLRLAYLPCVLAIALISFGINIATVHQNPELAFYSPQSRAWELMLGAALACVRMQGVGPWAGTANLRAALGTALILVGLFALNRNTVFPGWAGLLPALGAVLIISAGFQGWVNQHILATRPFVAIGLISYPLYLWHWPALLLFERYVSAFDATPLARPLLKAATLLCCGAASWLTFRFVEAPFRFGRWRGPRYSAALVAAMAIIGLSAAAAPTAIVTTAALSPYQREMMPALRRAAERQDVGEMFGSRSCFSYQRGDGVATFTRNHCTDLKYPDAKTVVLTGDSHAASLSLGLAPLMARDNINLLQVTAGGCEPTSTDPHNRTCGDMNELTATTISTVAPDLVIIDAWWMEAMKAPNFAGGDYAALLLAKIGELQQRGAKAIFVIGEMPIWQPSLPEALARNFVQRDLPIPKRTLVGIDRDSLALDRAMKSFPYPSGVTYLSVKDALCDADGCLTAVGPDLANDIVVWDYGHLTPAAAQYLTHGLIEPALKAMWPALPD